MINRSVAIVDNLLPEELFRRRETIKVESSFVVPNRVRNNVATSNGWMKWKVVLVTMATILSMIFHLKLEEGEDPEEGEVEEVLREKQEEMEEEQVEERRNRESVASAMNQVTPG